MNYYSFPIGAPKRAALLAIRAALTDYYAYEDGRYYLHASIDGGQVKIVRNYLQADISVDAPATIPDGSSVEDFEETAAFLEVVDALYDLLQQDPDMQKAAREHVHSIGGPSVLAVSKTFPIRDIMQCLTECAASPRDCEYVRFAIHRNGGLTTRARGARDGLELCTDFPAAVCLEWQKGAEEGNED